MSVHKKVQYPCIGPFLSPQKMTGNGMMVLFVMVLTAGILTCVITAWHTSVSNYTLMCSRIDYEKQIVCTQVMLNIGIMYVQKKYAALLKASTEKLLSLDALVAHLSAEYSGTVTCTPIKAGVVIRAQLEKNKESVCGLHCLVAKKGDTWITSEWHLIGR